MSESEPQLLLNPTFVAHLHAAIDLHVLLAMGLDDSKESEGIRDQTDELWHSLSKVERDELGKFSESLYKIMEPVDEKPGDDQ